MKYPKNYARLVVNHPSPSLKKRGPLKLPLLRRGLGGFGSADEDKSRAATQALADYQRDITELKSDSRLIPCLLTFNLTLTVAILWKVFS